MSKVRLYGAQIGHGSWSRVTAGLVEALDAHHLLGGVHYYDSPEEPAIGDELVAIYVGHPAGWERMTTFGEHKHRLVVLAPNSSWLPDGVVELLKQYATGVLAPSRWAAKVIRNHYSGDVRMVNHGVDRAGLVVGDVEYTYRDGLHVLHMTSSARQRKGTGELITAWQSFSKRHPGSQLTIVADWVSSVVATEDDPSITLVPRVEFDTRQMAKFYRRFDCVCQPSRAEGFGLCPLEALVAGVPIIATSGTGHREYLGAERPFAQPLCATEEILTSDYPSGVGTIDDGPGAVAPVVRPEQIDVALENMFNRREEARRDAFWSRRTLAEYWAWPLVLWRSGLVSWLEEQ